MDSLDAHEVRKCITLLLEDTCIDAFIFNISKNDIDIAILLPENTESISVLNLLSRELMKKSIEINKLITVSIISKKLFESKNSAFINNVKIGIKKMSGKR